MKYIFIKLSDNLIDALYQLISATVISEYQEGILVLEESSNFKNTIFRKYNFQNVACRNSYIENTQTGYNSFTTKVYKNNLELVGQFKNVNLFIHHVDEFIKSLFIDGYENDVALWLEQVNTFKKSVPQNDNISLNLFSNRYVNSVEHRGGWKDVITNLIDNNFLSTNDSNYYLLDIIENYKETPL